MIKSLSQGVALALVFLATAAGLRFAANAGWIGADSGARAIQVVIGLGLALYGNLMPKQIGAARRSARAETAAQAALRVGGWSMTLAGLAYAALWALAPRALADTGGMIAVGAATALTFGYAVWSFATCRGARTQTGG